MEKDNLETSVRLEIKRNLDKCDSTNTPGICEIIKTHEGYRKIESMVIFKLIYEQISIGAAIAQIEMEML